MITKDANAEADTPISQLLTGLCNYVISFSILDDLCRKCGRVVFTPQRKPQVRSSTKQRFSFLYKPPYCLNPVGLDLNGPWTIL